MVSAAHAVSAAPGAARTSDARAYRLTSIDFLRGLVIVIMALDHVRDYVMMAAEQDPMANPNIGVALFFTRWVTHFCAPVFVFLAGTSAGLIAARKTPVELGRFLLVRGLWLIAVEFFIVSTAWTFAPWGIPEVGGLVLVPMQVIWAIGASMVVLAGAQFLGARLCLFLGLLVVCGHNLLDPVWPATNLIDPAGPFWAVLHSQKAMIAGPFFLVFTYPVLAWIGVMLLGFGAAPLFQLAPHRRDARLLALGLGATLAFVVIRASGVYGDPNPWQAHGTAAATLIDFLNVTKYPPSLLYLLMTLGPAALLCARADRIPPSLAKPFVLFGRVPFGFYVAHLVLIHTISIVLGMAQGFQASQFLTLQLWFPKGYGVNLAGVYTIWVLVVLGLYPFCAWVAGVKARRRDWWLSYV